MPESHVQVDVAIEEAQQTRRTIRKKKTKRVTSNDERLLLKGTALAWFRKHRTAILCDVDASDLEPIDQAYQRVLEASARATLRKRYLDELRIATDALVALRSKLALFTSPATSRVEDPPPDFSQFVGSLDMQAVLRGRWEETVLCLQAGAHLAATVMMGGLLEALLLARVNRMADLSSAFTAKAAPKDRNGKTRPLKEWTLKDYIDVAHELEWITASAKNVGAVLRDYRNYIHPQKQLAHGIQISEHDSRMFWQVSKSIASQIIAS